MKTIGLDLSLSGTGIATGARCITVSVPSSLKGPARLAAIRRAVHHEIRGQEDGEGRDGVDVAVIEGYAMGVQGAGVRSNAELGGVIRLLLYDLGIGIITVPPASLKLFATGSGRAQKHEMIDAAVVDANGLYGIGDDNQADAYWLRQLGLAVVGKRRPTERQEVALANVVVDNAIRRMALV